MLLAILLLTFAEVFVCGGTQLCLPKCAISHEGVGICRRLMQHSECMVKVDIWFTSVEKRPREKNELTKCACAWETTLISQSSKFSNQKKIYHDCLTFNSRTCQNGKKNEKSKVKNIKFDWLADLIHKLRDEESKVDRLPDKEERHRARQTLIHTINVLMSAVQTPVKAAVTASPKSTTKKSIVNKDVWKTRSAASKKLHPMKNDTKVKMLFFSCIILTVLFVLICALFLKLKYDRTGSSFDDHVIGDLHIHEKSGSNNSINNFLEKLRIRSRAKAEENEVRGTPRAKSEDSGARGTSRDKSEDSGVRGNSRAKSEDKAVRVSSKEIPYGNIDSPKAHRKTLNKQNSQKKHSTRKVSSHLDPIEESDAKDAAQNKNKGKETSVQEQTDDSDAAVHHVDSESDGNEEFTIFHTRLMKDYN